MTEKLAPGALAGATGAGGNQVRNEGLLDATSAVEKPVSATTLPTVRLIRWIPFVWDVIGSATVACGDRIVDDVQICTVGGLAFALVKRPAEMSEREWRELADAALALVRKVDPGALAGTVDL